MYSRYIDIFRIVLIPLCESLALCWAFWISYDLRSITSWIPFLDLRIPYISPEQFSPFIVAGIGIWIITFARGGLYSEKNHGVPLVEEIRQTLLYSFFWFFVYIGFVYLTTGFLFSKEIPRLIILYTAILSILFTLIIRITLRTIWKILYTKGWIAKQKILIIQEKNTTDDVTLGINDPGYEYIYCTPNEKEYIENLIRTKEIVAILLTSGEYTTKKTFPLLILSGIYGISCTYPHSRPHEKHFIKKDTFLGGIPVVEMNTVSINLWQRIVKRMLDIILGVVFILLTLPLMIIIYIGIKIEDGSGPVIYKNRRIGQNGKIFTLYKFRYMYWKYCIKEEYPKYAQKDGGLAYEEALKQKNNTREGPLYKIENDPRKMKFGGLIEKFSLDELPQFFNILLGNMSLVGPRPHQPREVALYEESDKQVLTIKPGITGMAQVHGRDKNSFQEEIMLDIYYIEHYSITLDIAIILRTIFVIFKRLFEGKKERQSLHNAKK